MRTRPRNTSITCEEELEKNIAARRAGANGEASSIIFPTRQSAARSRIPSVLVLLALLACAESPTEPVATSVTIMPRVLAMVGVGAGATLVAEVRDQNGRIMTGVRVLWTSSNTSVATVDSRGEVTATGYGHAVINATYEAAVGAAAAIVEQPIRSVIVVPTNDTVVVGDSVRYRAYAIYENGDTVPNAEPVWSTSDPVLVSVEAGTGLATGKGEGKATITATIRGTDGSAGIKVVSPDWAALVALYRATDGDNWDRNQGWLTDVPIGQWIDVTTDGDRVISLELWDNNLNGPIPPEIGKLSEVFHLYLFDNNLTGPIPASLGKLRNLVTLMLSSNDLTGHIPGELGNLHRLRTLSLWYNNLTGTIPASIFRLQELERLYLTGNNLTGPIPPGLSNLTGLRWLHLSSNDFSGPIPAELSSMTRLYQLSLGGNDLTGPIPPELGKLSSVQGLSFGGNALTGSIPPELGELSGLLSLDLRDNDLTGPIPPELGNLGSLQYLGLINNYLSGSIPAELGDLYSLTGLGLDGNNLTGSIPPELGNLRNLGYLGLQRNELMGTLPPELANLRELKTLYVDGNGLTGRIPQEFINLQLDSFQWNGTQLCAPANGVFQAWLRSIPQQRGGATCSSTGGP